MSEERRVRSSQNGDSQSFQNSRKTCERIFDEILEDYEMNPLVRYVGMPRLEPILYEPPLKWRRIAVLHHEQDERERLMGMGYLSEKDVDIYAKAASYYPGITTRYQTLDKAIMYSVTPPRISFSSSDDEASPRFLFKDLPAETSKKWSGTATCNTSSLVDTITTPQSSPSLRQVTPQKRTNSDGLPEVSKTPQRPVIVDVNYPSPIFDSSKIKRRNRRKIVIPLPPKIHESVADSSKVPTNVEVEEEEITIRRRSNPRSPIYVGR